jgi:hypothetical protein
MLLAGIQGSTFGFPPKDCGNDRYRDGKRFPQTNAKSQCPATLALHSRKGGEKGFTLITL